MPRVTGYHQRMVEPGAFTTVRATVRRHPKPAGAVLIVAASALSLTFTFVDVDLGSGVTRFIDLLLAS